MQDFQIEKIYKCLSKDRFQPYRVDTDVSFKPALARYLWNIALCEALYPSLNTVEVLLRNSLHNFFTSLYGTPLWFNQLPLKLHQEQSLKATIKYLIERKKIHISTIQLMTPKEHETYNALELGLILTTLINETPNGKEPGMIVAGMNFGFWTTFFHNDFEGFWRKNPKLSQVFPYFRDKPQGDLLRKPLNKRFLAIKEQLRNRVFHHEPIWNQRILHLNYQKMLDVIYWINPEKYILLKTLNRFPEIYHRGWQYYEALLEQTTDVPIGFENT